MLVGRRIWIIREPAHHVPGYIEGGDKGMVVVKFRQFLPAGPHHLPSGEIVNRKLPLIQLITDPPGTRTLAVGEIRLSRPY